MCGVWLPATFGKIEPEGGIPWQLPQAGSAWHSVLLKQPGAEPAGAGNEGGAMGEFAPFAWQSAHTEAFPVLVSVCVYVPVIHDVGCGPLPPWQLKHEICAMPPEKSSA